MRCSLNRPNLDKLGCSQKKWNCCIFIKNYWWPSVHIYIDTWTLYIGHTVDCYLILHINSIFVVSIRREYRYIVRFLISLKFGLSGLRSIGTESNGSIQKIVVFSIWLILSRRIHEYNNIVYDRIRYENKGIILCFKLYEHCT